MPTITNSTARTANQSEFYMDVGFELDLPKPPSVNSIWRNGRGRTHLSARYKTWKRVADNMVMARKSAGSNLPEIHPVRGPFHAVITIDRSTRRKNEDIDNRIKAVLDFLERAALIENDSLAETVTIRWGNASEGARVQIVPTVAT